MFFYFIMDLKNVNIQFTEEFLGFTFKTAVLVALVFSEIHTARCIIYRNINDIT